MHFTNVLLFTGDFGIAKFEIFFFLSQSVGSACHQMLCSEYVTQCIQLIFKGKKYCLALHCRSKQATFFNNEHLFTCDYKQPC